MSQRMNVKSLVEAAQLRVKEARLRENLQKRLDNIRHTPEPDSQAGAFSFLALSAIVAYLAWHFGGFHVVLADLPAFLSGHALELQGDHIFAGCLATIMLMLVGSIAAIFVVAFMVGNSKGEHAVAKELANMMPGNQFGNLLFVVFLEELIARGFFLGLLTKIPYLDGAFGFYAMFVVGNLIWAVIHLTNFTDPKDRSVWRVLPQFVGGVLLTYIFAKYGFWMGLVVHLGFDALLFATHKREKLTSFDFALTAYAGIVALIAYWCMTKPISDLSPWFQDTISTFAIPGWGFWDYFKSHLVLSMGLQFVFGVLLFDRIIPSKEDKKESDGQKLLSMVFGPIAAVALLYALFWLIGFVSKNLDVRIVLLSILVCSFQRGRSGSSVARSFWCAVPQLFVAFFMIEALGFWWASLAIGLLHLIQFPMQVWARAREEEVAKSQALSKTA